MVGVGVLAALVAPTEGIAQNAPDIRQVGQAAQRRTFDIPPQTLQSALVLFGQQSGRQIAADGAATRGVSSPGVQGTMSIEEALRRLLAGTGFTYDSASGSTITVQKIGASGAAPGVMQLDPLQVQGLPVPPQATIDNLPPAYAGGQVATGSQLGVLGNRDFMDTPFTQTGYTAQLIQNQQARNIADVAANNPSVRNLWSGASYTTVLMIRGFPVNPNDISFDGLYGIAPTLTVTPEYVDRVEILEGPSAMLNGMPPFGSIGGTVNLVPKRAGKEPLNELTTTYASNTQFGGHIDFSRRFGEDQNIGFRFNGVYRNGNTPVDRQTQELGAAVFGLDFRGDRFRASIDYGYQSQTVNDPFRSTNVVSGVAVPAAPNGSSNWFQPWSYDYDQALFAALHLEYDVAPNWTVFAAAGGRQSSMSGLMGLATVTSANANLTDSYMNLSSWTVSNTEELGIRGRVETGAIKHSLTLAGERLQSEFGQLYPTVASIQSNLYSPTFVAKPAVATVGTPKANSTVLTSLALADVLSVADERVQLILGGRYQQVQIGTFSNTGAMTAYYDQSAFTPAVGFVVKPWTMLSLYGSYIQALQQGPTAPTGTTNTGQVFPPVISRQFELGAKVDFGRFATTLSAFQIEQPQGVTDPSTLAFSVSGEQRNRGLEWNIFGEPLPGFRSLGGITLLNGIQENTGSPLTNGLKATGVPDVQLNLGAEWDTTFLRGLTLSGRVIYTSMQYLNTANTQSIPAWTRFDAGARYTFDRADGKPITIRLNVQNVFNLGYWASANSAYGLSLGEPRTFLLSLTSNF